MQVPSILLVVTLIYKDNLIICIIFIINKIFNI